MRKLLLFLCITTVLLTSSLAAQTKYNFTLQFTFEGVRDGLKTQFSTFLEPKSGTWLLTKDDTFGGQVFDIHHWILKPNGEIIMIADNEFEGPPVILKVKNYGLKKTPLKLNAKIAGKAKRYGKNKYNWPTYLATPYNLQIGRLTQKSYLVKTNYNFAPLYAYNSCLDIENYLPAFSKFNYSEVIPRNYLVTEDTEVKLLSVSPTEYYLEVPK
jgi:hypothetical protein